jgi:hypothetical protein
MLTDSRGRVRAAGLKALARVHRQAGREAALSALDAGQGGRVAWAAAEVLRDGVPRECEADVLARVALDEARAPGQRFRAMALLRPVRWFHLAVVLEAHEQAGNDEFHARLRGERNTWNGSRLTRAPDPEIRRRIERLLPTLDDHRRQWIEFVLRTSR